MRKWIVLDWETRSSCDLKKAGSYRYAVDPTTEILCVTLGNTAGRVTWHPGLPLPPIIAKALAEGWTWVAHKTDFERNIWKAIATPEHGWPECPPLELWHDTQSRAYQLALPGALENVLRVLGLAHQKDMDGSKLTIGLSKPDRKGHMPTVTRDILARVCAYCEADIDGEVGLVQRLGWLPECEREPWVMSQEMNDRGIRLDLDLVDAMQTVVDLAIPPLAAEFHRITGLKPTQLQKFRGWLLAEGVDLPNLRKETVAELLEGEDEHEDSDAEDDLAPPDEDLAVPVDLAPHVRRSLEIKALVGSSSIKKLKAMKAVVGYDGRARGLIVYHRTTPGRGGGTLLQPHNFPRPTLKMDGEPLPIEQTRALINLIKARDPELLEMTYGVGAVEVVVSALRHTLIPDPDARFMSGDYSGIQARVVLALAGQHDKTAMMAAGLDTYIDLGADIHHLPKPAWDDKAAVKQWKLAHPAERQDGKNGVLGFGFQLGEKTASTKYFKGDLERAALAVKTYRKEWAPKVPELWYGIQDAAIDTVRFGNPHQFNGITYRMEDRWLTAEVQNGTKIWYYNPRAFRKPMWWDETDVRWAIKYDVMKAGHWVTRDAFGGQLVENLVMKIEREIMEDAKRRLKKYGYPIVLEVHDENLAEVKKGFGSLDEFKEILEDVDDWVRDLQIPIQVDCWEGDCYRK